MKRFFFVFPLFVMLLTKDFTVALSHHAFYDGDSSSVITPNCEQIGIPGCPRDFNPVCGTDSITYANECILCESNRDKGQNIKMKWRGPCF